MRGRGGGEEGEGGGRRGGGRREGKRGKARAAPEGRRETRGREGGEAFPLSAPSSICHIVFQR